MNTHVNKCYFTVVHNCKTVSGADPGANCVFPFTFGEVVYNKCTTVGDDTAPWCSTLTDENGVHVGGQGKWGYCAANCPILVQYANCVNDGSTGDEDGFTCSGYYDLNPGECGQYDTENFTASVQCCGCQVGNDGKNSHKPLSIVGLISISKQYTID